MKSLQKLSKITSGNSHISMVKCNLIIMCWKEAKLMEPNKMSNLNRNFIRNMLRHFRMHKKILCSNALG